MAIQNRRGLEADFDPNKMLPGEWAVSTDKKYVRMCFAAGICLRMATYEAFEADMEQIRVILAEAQNINEAVSRIQNEINDTAIEVENNAVLAESYTHGGTGKREGEDTDNAQYYMEEAKKAAGGVDEYAREQLEELSQTVGGKADASHGHKEIEDSIKEACDGVDKLVNSILDTIAEVEDNEEEKKIAGALALKELNKATAKTIAISTSNGYSTMAADIGAKWSEITAGTSGTVIVNNGATLYHGTYYKYSEAFGSIHMTDCSTGIVYVWNCNGGNYQLDEIGKAKDFLPLTGGTLIGNLKIEHSYYPGYEVRNQGTKKIGSFGVHNDWGTSYLACENMEDSNDYSVLKVDIGSSAHPVMLTRRNASGFGDYKIFGEHNKPSGSYTGNGDATERIIDTGGIGNFIAINSGYGFAVLGMNGGIFSMNGSGSGRYVSSEAKFLNGKLYIRTSHGAINTNGSSLDYQVL